MWPTENQKEKRGLIFIHT